MQTPISNHQSNELPNQAFGAVSGLVNANDGDPRNEQMDDTCSTPFVFRGEYAGRMDMSADRQTVTRYLDDHQAWFLRCAHPMTAVPLGDNGYDLTVGNFGALGYDVEPKIGLHLLPQDHGIYRIETIPVPGYEPPGYDVDFKASLQLNETTVKSGDSSYIITQVDWELDLKVCVNFPRFINALPKRLIQRTGDHLLSQIVRQVSRCLTHKVQEDFHETLQLPLPDSYRKRSHHFFDRFSKKD
ncbi:DUF1997 domain-containing protein [Oscillatoria sp. CS-180]|uniref:DUF1997 domain-containing protein n=1 Tax=Oscillatoria sp. CS-180 TaxID=3021720 RepID=UPI00232B3704|nr:DUF1997 domain-containing protein [Oscillatoria sp. CS-180]MDB9526072.1 DUF1997 domain-containing protein [Oscillatoria sp. CS-180]